MKIKEKSSKEKIRKEKKAISRLSSNFLLACKCSSSSDGGGGGGGGSDGGSGSGGGGCSSGESGSSVCRKKINPGLYMGDESAI